MSRDIVPTCPEIRHGWAGRIPVAGYGPTRNAWSALQRVPVLRHGVQVAGPRTVVRRQDRRAAGRLALATSRLAGGRVPAALWWSELHTGAQSVHVLPPPPRRPWRVRTVTRADSVPLSCAVMSLISPPPQGHSVPVLPPVMTFRAAVAMFSLGEELSSIRVTVDPIGILLPHRLDHPLRPIDRSLHASHRSSGSATASEERSPPSRIAVAAAAIASIATQVSPPPTLTRCAPAWKISGSERPGRASTLTGLETASQTARISSTVRRPGA